MFTERQHDTPGAPPAPPTAPVPPTFAPGPGRRAGAGAAALALFAAFAVVGVIGLLVVAHIAQVPNAYDSGREYGSAPNTWGGTYRGVAVSAVIIFGVMWLLTAVGAQLQFATTGTRLSRRGWIVAPSTLTAVVMVALVGLLFADRGSAQPLTNCSTFQFDRAAFVSTDRKLWEPQSRALDDCQLIDSSNRAQILAKLGSAEEDEYSALRYHDGALVIEFKEEDVDGRPVSVWAW